MDVLVPTDFYHLFTTEVRTWGGLVTYMPSKSTSLTTLTSARIKARGTCADQPFPASAEGKPKPQTDMQLTV